MREKKRKEIIFVRVFLRFEMSEMMRDLIGRGATETTRV